MYRRNLENKINKLQLLKKRRNLDKLGDKAYSITRWQRCLLLRRCSTSGLRCTSTSPRKAFADSCLEDGELQKLLASPLYAWRASGKTDAMVVQEREVSAQFAQANRKESLRSHSSEGQKALGKPNALFSSEQGNLIRSSVFRNANPSNLRGSLLESNKDHLLNQARSDLAKQELHVESLNKCIGELQRQREEHRLALQDAQHVFVESRREEVRLQEDLSMKEKVLRNSHDTKQQLTSQLQQMQEQMNSMNSSGEFQERNQKKIVEDCLTFPVNLKWFRVLFRCSAATKDCRLIHGINPNSPRDYFQRFLSDDVQRNREAVPEAERKKTIHIVKTDKIKAQFQGRHLQQGRWLRVLQYPWNFRRILWLDSKDSKYRNCN